MVGAVNGRQPNDRAQAAPSPSEEIVDNRALADLTATQRDGRADIQTAAADLAERLPSAMEP